MATTTCTCTTKAYLKGYNITYINSENGTNESAKLTTSREVVFFPLLNAQWESTPEAPYWAHIFIGLIALIVGAVGLIGNVVVIVLFIRNKSLRRSSNLFALNLACGDTLLIIANVPVLVISSFKGAWIGGVPGCRLFAFAGGLAGFVSINTLTVLAVERCVVIVYHLPSTMRLSKRGTLTMCGCVWIYSFMWSIPPYLGWGGHMMEGSRTSCTLDYFTRTVNNRSYVISILIFCFVLQLIVISVAYSRIAMEVFLHQNEIDYSHYKCENTTFRLRVASCKKKRNIEWRTAKAVFCLILMFCFSWIPYATVAVIGQFGNQSSITPLSSAFPGIFAKMSSFMNPVLYTLLHPTYRKLIFPCCIKCRDFNFRQSHSSSKGFSIELSDYDGQTRSTSA